MITSLDILQANLIKLFMTSLSIDSFWQRWFKLFNSWFSADVISLCKLRFRHVGAHAMESVLHFENIDVKLLSFALDWLSLLVRLV